MLMRLISSLETFMNNKYFLMLSSSQEGRQITLFSLSLTQIMHNNIYKQLEKSEDKNQAIPIHLFSL